jgi:acyl carrier protein
MTVVSEITEFVKSDLLQGANNNVGPDDALIEDGILTSLQTVELVMFIEEKYGIEIEPELVNEENFRTLGTVASIVESKLGA